MSIYKTPSSTYHPGIDFTQDFPDSISARNKTLKGEPHAPLNHRKNWERCIVRAVYPDNHSCDVFTEKGKYLAGIAWPDSGRKVPKRGEKYAVHFHMGKPALERIQADAKRSPVDSEVPKLTAAKGIGGDDGFYKNKGSGNHRGSGPRDVLPGDWFEMGTMGNLIAVLEGGTTVLKASELAQIIASQSHHLLRLIGKSIKMDTGAGTLDFTTEEGKSTLNLYMGSDEETEGSPAVENYRIRCEMGSDGELVDFRVTDGKGRSVYRVHVDPDGRVQKKSTRETHVIAQDRRTEIGTMDETTVGRGKISRVSETFTEEIGGDHLKNLGGSFKVRAAQTAALSALENLLLTASKGVEISSSGSLTDSNPSMVLRASNGDMVFDVGNPAYGDAQVSRSGFDVSTFTGDITFKPTLGSFEVNTNVPNSVKLGGPGPGVFSAVLYETFYSFMELFGTLIDTHTHAVPALGGVPTAPPLSPMWTPTKSLLRSAKSSYVSYGG